MENFIIDLLLSCWRWTERSVYLEGGAVCEGACSGGLQGPSALESPLE